MKESTAVLVNTLVAIDQTYTVIYSSVQKSEPKANEATIVKFLAELGVLKPVKRETFPDLLDFLKLAPRSEKEFYEYILTRNTKSADRSWKHNNQIRNAINAIHAKGGNPVVEEKSDRNEKVWEDSWK